MDGNGKIEGKIYFGLDVDLIISTAQVGSAAFISITHIDTNKVKVNVNI